MQAQPQPNLTDATSVCTSSACPKCKSEYVTVEQLIMGEEVLTLCHCKACGFSWKLSTSSRKAKK